MLSPRTLGMLLLAAAALSACDGGPRDLLPWKGYYAATHSMEPTLPKGTRFFAWSVSAADLERGDVVVVRTREQEWVVRLVGMPGDSVAMVGGQIVLNGKPVPQRRAGSQTIEDMGEAREYAVFRERLPGEARFHNVLDFAATPYDNTEPVVLGEDDYFLLGDNRDNAADSRVDFMPFGLGIVHGAQIIRKVELD